MQVSDATLFDEFQVHGIWWLPDKPEQWLHGTLFFKGGDRIRLDLSGAFGDVGRQIFLADSSRKVIHGFSAGGSPCTLLDAIELKHPSLMVPEASTSTFVGSRLYVGKHYTSKDEIRFSSMSVSLTYLEEWLALRTFEIPMGCEAPARITIPYWTREVFKAVAPNRGGKVSVHSSLGFSTRTNSVSCKHQTYIRLEPTESQNEEWFEEFRRNVENLLTLLVGEPVYPKKIGGYGEEHESPPGKKRREKILIFNTLLDPRVKERVHFSDMPLPFSLVEKEITHLFESWLSEAETFGAVHRLLLGTIYNRRMYLESEFLSLTQALETYHRRKFGGTYVPADLYKDYYDELVKGLPAGMPDTLKRRLSDYLTYGNEYSLRKRLKQLLSGLSEATRKEISPKEEEFVDSVVSTRNYFTHYNEELKVKAATDLESQFNLNGKLRALITILLLKEAGLSEHVVAPRILGARGL